MSFEADLARLEQIVAELQRDDLELDRALALFQEGVARLRTAAASLVEVEAKVQLLNERPDGSFDLRALDG
ncbi:MAG: exodeoxyribonuclease VII small subunit [Gemmatimonadota bacterium]|nr:exodeoxyribonuclease VII small subunit [Gemmatimonadota bacterium]